MFPESLIRIVINQMCINKSPVNQLLLSAPPLKRNLAGLLILKQEQAERPRLHKTIKAHSHERPAVLCSTCTSANAITLTIIMLRTSASGFEPDKHTRAGWTNTALVEFPVMYFEHWPLLVEKCYVSLVYNDSKRCPNHYITPSGKLKPSSEHEEKKLEMMRCGAFGVLSVLGHWNKKNSNNGA